MQIENPPVVYARYWRTFLIILLLVPLLTGILIPQALAQKVTSSNFDQQVYYQGDSGILTVELLNDHDAFQIGTKQFYLQFDWQESQNLIFDSGDTPNIASGQSHTFRISFNIPGNIAIGPHKYKVVWVDRGVLLGTVTVLSGLMNIHDAFEKIYNSLVPAVNSKVSLATGYVSPEAKSLVQQAQTSIATANSLAQQGQWKEAVDKLNTASNQLDQASAAEQTFQNQQRRTPSSVGSNGQPSQVIPNEAIVGIAIAVIVIVVGVIMFSRRKKHRGAR